MQLLRTEFYALLSAFGTGLLDRRDVQAAQPAVHDSVSSRVPTCLEPRVSHRSGKGSLGGPPIVYFGVSPSIALSESGSLWIDYVADIGDSWDATFATLSLLARKALLFRMLDSIGIPSRPDAEPTTELPRAHVLVLGGDMVYPTPYRDAYRTRTLSAFIAAFPDKPLDEKHPALLAIPGNHDWYDGLTAFTREFCQGRGIGAWRTVQGRSYFAVKLHPHWWLFGIDIALESRVDAAQQRYFLRLLTDHQAEAAATAQNSPGKPRIILCTAKPVWLAGPYRTAAAYRNLADFADLLRAHGAETTVVLAGDTHHYSHYVSPTPPNPAPGEADEHMFVVGGGGSYLSATHDLSPVTRKVTKEPRASLVSPVSAPAGVTTSVSGVTSSPPPKSPRPAVTDGNVPQTPEQRDERRRPDATRRFTLNPLTYPSQAASRRMVWGALRTPLRAENIPFVLLVGLLYVAFTSLWHTVGGAPPPFVSDSAFRTQMTKILADPPWAAWTFGAALVTLCAGFAIRGTQGLRWFRIMWGAIHGVVHLIAALWLLAWILRGCDVAANACVPLVPWLAPFRNTNLTAWHVLFVVIGGLMGTTIFSVYLVISDRLFGWHTNEVFMVQGIINYRSFLRMRLDKDGTLTIYPIGLRETPTQWRARACHPDDLPDTENPSLYQPGNGTLEPVLIEAPIEIKP